MISVAYEKWVGTPGDRAPHPVFRALRESRLDSFLADSQDDGVLIVDRDGSIIDCNRALTHRTGHSRHEVIGRTMVEIVVPSHQRRIRAALADSASGDGVRVRATGIKASGDTCELAITFVPLFDHNSHALGSLVITQNLSEAADVLRDRERQGALLALAGRVAGFVGFSLDRDSGDLVWSGALPAVPGALPSTLDQFMAALSTTDGARLARALEKSERESRLLDITLSVSTSAGERHLRLVGEPAIVPGSMRPALSGAAHDVTDAVVEQQQRREVEQLLSTTVNAMTDGLGIIDADWRFTFVNDRMVQMIGVDRDAVIGSTLWAVVPELGGTEFEIGFRSAVETASTVHVRDRIDARDAWLEAIAYPSGGGLAVHLRDITDSEVAALRYRHAQEQLATLGGLLDISRDAIVVRDPQHRIRYANAGALDLYGWQADSIIGSDSRDLLTIDPDLAEHAMATVLAEEHWSGRFEVRTGDGRDIVVSSRWQLMRDDRGEPEAVLSVSADVTDEVSREESLRRTERLESLGTFAGGIAHDLNNVLTPILMASQLLGSSLEGTPDRDVVAMIETAARRGADMVRQVLAFTRGVESRIESIELAALLDELQAMVRESLRPSIELVVESPSQPVTFSGDATQLLQVLANLVSNANDAIEGPGAVTIKSRLEIDDDASDNCVVIDVIDDGHGISPEVIARLWEPFFTTKPVGEGTGLGLPMAAAIMRSHGGSISAHSDGESGSCFTLRLPAAASAVVSTPTGEVPSSPMPRGHGELVLVVDDEQAIRSVVRQVLAAHGYEVFVASSGREARLLIDSGRVMPDLVLSDVTMPHGDGIELVEQLIDDESTVPIILMSGLEDRATVSQPVGRRARGFLVKPLSTPTLLHAVHDALTHHSRERAMS
ncbi:hybrid sensor histidine kinase/response regulator [Microcella sp.]|uniref:hybrid sensor histidine kinase/response regulator n=1 Tax=Microcella sp. TaxID=1913979 RepID=UPI0025634BEC|nr:PAS domain-containing protein [Microcella sp.]MBX9472891.1 PAS domain-containing protein [Microcella sp.]